MDRRRDTTLRHVSFQGSFLRKGIGTRRTGKHFSFVVRTSKVGCSGIFFNQKHK